MLNLFFCGPTLWGATRQTTSSERGYQHTRLATIWELVFSFVLLRCVVFVLLFLFVLSVFCVCFVCVRFCGAYTLGGYSANKRNTNKLIYIYIYTQTKIQWNATQQIQTNIYKNIKQHRHNHNSQNIK